MVGPLFMEESSRDEDMQQGGRLPEPYSRGDGIELGPEHATAYRAAGNINTANSHIKKTKCGSNGAGNLQLQCQRYDKEWWGL